MKWEGIWLDVRYDGMVLKAFVVEESRATVRLRLIGHPKKTYIDKPKESSHMKPLYELDKDDLLELIDMALDLKDDSWFYKLVARLKTQELIG
jgi:uncharacterized protein YpiB (UPF0302 family)